MGNKEYILQIGKKFKDNMGNITTSILEEKFIASLKIKEPSVDEVTPISSDAIKLLLVMQSPLNKQSIP